jgi:hypothetical protein
MVSDRKVIANIPRLHQYMDANGLEAIAIRSGVNFTYLAGMALPGTLARHLDLANTVRGFMLLWPRKGEPVIVLDLLLRTSQSATRGSRGSRYIMPMSNLYIRVLQTFWRILVWTRPASALRKMV